MRLGIPVVGANLTTWANDLRRWMERSLDRLSYLPTDGSVGEDGTLMWSPAGYPVVSRSGEWRQLIMADGYAIASMAADVTAAAADTAYALSWDDLQFYEGISLVSGTRITFDKPGYFFYGFSATLQSSVGSDVTFHLWPRVNGVDVPSSNIRHTLHDNGAEATVGRSGMFYVSAGDYIESMWAVSNTAGRLKADAATAFSPSAPSATISITRVRA